MHIPIDPVIPLLGSYPIKIHAHGQRYMYQVIPFNIAYSKEKEQPKCPSKDQLNKL